jgi:hypothetical protein
VRHFLVREKRNLEWWVITSQSMRPNTGLTGPQVRVDNAGVVLEIPASHDLLPLFAVYQPLERGKREERMFRRRTERRDEILLWAFGTWTVWFATAACGLLGPVQLKAVANSERDESFRGTNSGFRSAGVSVAALFLDQTMAKRADFSKERRTQGRSLNTAVHDLADLMKGLAEEQGVDLQASLDEAGARKAEERRELAERLQQSVVPLFIGDAERRPDRIGSCVLVRLESDFFAFTAAHVIRDVGSSRLFAPSEAKGGKLLPLPPCTACLSPASGRNDLDVGVLVLPASELGVFQQHVFLTCAEIDQDDQPDDEGLGTFYFVLGYSASRTQVKVSKTARHIHQKSFHCATSSAAAAEYLQEEMSQSDYLLLDFDHKNIVIGGKRVNPPKLQGVSGGGIFNISRNTKKGPLVAIATQNRRKSRLIVGTRLKHFLAMVRELRTHALQTVSLLTQARRG